MERIYRILHLDLSQQNDRNAWYLILEIIWASILASAASFNAAFAVHLGASNADIGWLNSIPALLAVIVSLPAGRFLQRRSRRKPWILWALTVYRLSYMMMALIPLIRLAHIPQGTMVVVWLILWTAPATFFNVGFIPMLADVIPEGNRAATFTARNVVSSAVLSLLNFLFGQWLYRVTFPLNYEVMYAFGVVTSMISVYYLVSIKVPDAIVPPVVARPARSLRQRVQSARSAINEYPGFFQIVLNTTLYGIGLWMVAPIYIVYYVRVLHATDAWIGLQGTIGSLATILGYTIFRGVMVRWGEIKTLKHTIILQGLFPFMVGISPSLTPILLAVALNGLVVAGINLSHVNTLLKLIPEDKRPEYTAIWTSLINSVAFICPVIGIALSSVIGVQATLIGCGLLSCLGAFSFWAWPVIKSEENAVSHEVV